MSFNIPSNSSRNHNRKYAYILTLVSYVMFFGLTACDQLGPINSGNSQSATDESKAENTDIDTKTANNRPPINIASPDWGNAATLTAMGYPPIATGDMRVWDQWVADPKLPDYVVDLGIRYQPNIELIAQLPVDMVIDNFFYEHARGLYGEGVAAESITFVPKGKTAQWSDYTEPTRKLGEVINEPELAERYIAASQQDINQAGRLLSQHYPKVEKFAVVQFADANNLRMYAANSLFQPALDLMGKQLIANGEGNEWGFVQTPLSELAKLDTDVCLLVVQPVSPITKAEVEKSLIWQRLDYDNTRCYGELPPVWIYGGLSSLVTLANNLSNVELKGGAAL